MKYILISWKVCPDSQNTLSMQLNQGQEKGSGLKIVFESICTWFYYHNVFQNYSVSNVKVHFYKMMLWFKLYTLLVNFTYFSLYTLSGHTFSLFSVFWLFWSNIVVIVVRQDSAGRKWFQDVIQLLKRLQESSRLQTVTPPLVWKFFKKLQTHSTPLCKSITVIFKMASMENSK